MFHQRSLNLEDLPLTRDPSQYYIHWNMESPAWNSLDKTDLKHFNDFFNFSMSYRQDADFPAPYGSIEQVNQIYFIDYILKICYHYLQIQPLPDHKELGNLYVFIIFSSDESHLASNLLSCIPFRDLYQTIRREKSKFSCKR